MTRGANYGWPQVEGSGGAPEFTDPLLTWTPDESSPSGLEVTGDAAYLASLRGRRLWRVPLTSDGVGAPEVQRLGVEQLDGWRVPARVRLSSLVQ